MASFPARGDGSLAEEQGMTADGAKRWVVLAVMLAAGQAFGAGLFPANGAKDVCPDVPLRVTLDQPAVLGAGKVQVFDAANDALVTELDVAGGPLAQAIGGIGNFRYLPVIVSDKQVELHLPNHVLAYGKTYYVKVGEKAIGGFGGAADANTWRFTTRAQPPAQGASRITVNPDGSADFATVQGAIDFLPEGNRQPVTIAVRNGTYHEIVVLQNRDAVTIAGEDRKKTIIAFPNNDKFNNNSGGNPFAPGANPSTAPARGGSVYRRGMFLAHRVNDLTITNLTLHNTTPQGGSQAEALIVNGQANAHMVLTGVDLYSFQDTLQINGQAYISDCYIEGDVDFMWGTGPCFFEKVHAKTLRSGAYYTQIRNPASHHGYVYKDCVFDGAPGVVNNMLSRIEPTRFPGSEVVLIDCVLSEAVSPVAWRIERATEAPGIHFWEFNSHDADGKPVDMSKRLPFSKQLKQPEDAETIRNYTDPKWVLGGEWDPAPRVKAAADALH
jgi:pectin methylesterase-like acyl-CoA thioesterase